MAPLEERFLVPSTQSSRLGLKETIDKISPTWSIESQESGNISWRNTLLF